MSFMKNSSVGTCPRIKGDKRNNHRSMSACILVSRGQPSTLVCSQVFIKFDEIMEALKVSLMPNTIACDDFTAKVA